MPRFLLVLALMVLTGCGAAVPTPSPGRSTPAPSVAPSPSPSPTPTLAATLAGCPPATTLSGLTALHRFGDDADDVAVDAAGHIWISASEGGRIHELARDGAELAVIPDANIPEGIVPLGNGDLLVAEQRTNRISMLHPSTRTLTPLLTIPNPSGNLGIDNISLTRDGNGLLVPDSPSGRLLRIALAGGPQTVVATGLGRPVAAVERADGSVLVAAENPAGLLAVGPSGSVRRLGGLGDLDEVILLNGLVYVTKLDAGQVLAVDPASGASRVLVGGSPAPQGLAALQDGRLILVDSTRQIAVALSACR